MKANAPDKIYACFGVFGLIQATEIRATSKDIEYIRKDAFIEKAVSYIQQHWIWNTKIIEDFRKYMKGE